MINNFVYDLPVKVYFGENQLKYLGEEIKRFGHRVLMIYGGGSVKRTGLYDRIIAEIKGAGLELFEFSDIEPNPRITSVNLGAQICKEKGIDVLLAVGGGSTLDATKFIGAGAYYDGDVWDIVTRKTPVVKCLPIVTFLTLAATGSEMDSGGVISNLETGEKTACAHPLLLPKVSFLDPAVTYTVGAYQTACGAVDIISHLIETYFNMEQDLYMLDCVMEGLLKTVIRYAPVAIKEPDNYEARANLMWAASWAINGFVRGSKRQPWSCHPMEHALSAAYDITHGLGLAILIPRWMAYTLDRTTMSKFHQFGRNVFGIEDLEPMIVAEKSIQLLSDFFFQTLQLKSSLSELGIDDSNLALMAEKVCGGGVLAGFKPLRQEDIESILRLCL